MFVPPDFEVPLGLAHEEFRLEPLGPEHNERDHRAWSSSVEHIRRTPGWAAERWPRPMTLEENRRDLARHAEDFRNRAGFTYTVLAGEEVVGCVYIYPTARPGHAEVQSWVTADRADLDKPLHDAVTTWLRQSWPFAGFTYAPR